MSCYYLRASHIVPRAFFTATKGTPTTDRVIKDNAVATALIESTWDGSITPSLIDYIRIPNKSPAFDPDWKANGHMDDAVALIANWCRANALDDMVLEVIQLEGRTPLIYIDVPGVGQDCVVLYGHLDKQPEMVGWHELLS